VSVHGHATPENKRVAILISILAALLAITEMAGKSAQTTALASNIEASNLWAFFQAKTIRMTTLRTAAESLEVDIVADLPPARADALKKRIDSWKATAQRYDTEPETGEGRKELAARAKTAEEKRDRAMGAYHHFEFASALFQIAIVLASAAIVTGVTPLIFVAIGVSIIGAGLGALGWVAPTLLHL
jgi:hypothetical protein